MNILLTGASGFIGGNLLPGLLADGHHVLALGRRFKAKIVDEKVSYFEGDLTDLDHDDLLRGCCCEDLPEVFIHVAGQAHLAQTEQTKMLFEKNNIVVTETALKLAARLTVKKFILLSSVSVLNDDEHDVYASTKRAAEKKVLDFCHANGMDYVILRPVVVYGEADEKGNMLKLIRQLDQGIFPLFHHGQNIKDILYVQNLVAVICAIVQQKQWDNQTLLLKDPQQVCLKDICEKIVGKLGRKCWLIPIPGNVIPLLAWCLTLLQRIGFLRNYNVASVKRLGSDVDFGQEMRDDIKSLMPYSTRQGLENTVQWYLKKRHEQLA